MKVFFDTEFSGLYKNTNLISIGLISEDGKQFYAEIEDEKLKNLDKWIEENVLIHTVNYGDALVLDIVNDENDFYIGDKQSIAQELKEWFAQFDEVQLISDVCHYDMVLLIDLFGTAFDLPENVCAACHDINQDIAMYEHITEQEAFDRNREDFLLNHKIEVMGAKHNAMYDAKVIREIYRIIGE